MAFHFRVLLLAFCIWLVSCTQIPNELKLAQEMLETKPDSALLILQKINPTHYKSESSRALYGLLFFQALDRNNQTLQPDSVLDFSVNYYQQKNQKHELAICYYYKARIHKKAQRFDEATDYYLKALDILQNSEDYYFLGKIHSDMGDICSLQKDFNESLHKYQLSFSYFQKANDTTEACFKYIDIGRTHKYLKDNKKAYQYFNKAIVQSSDSFVHGAAYQEIGIYHYYVTKKNDSVLFYLNKSLQYPFRGTSYAIRCYIISDAYYDKKQYDSAIHYSKLSFNYPTTFFIKRECFRILANSEYNRANFEKAGVYLGKYQDCADSIRIIESQTKTTVLENLHDTTEETKVTKRNMAFIGSISLIITLFFGFIAFSLYKRNKLKKDKLNEFKEQLIQKQVFFSQNLSKKMEELRDSQAEERKNASHEERIRLDKELYEKCLHLNNWDAFVCEMNHAFNNIVDVLQRDYPGITHKEIIWSCLHLLIISNSDRMMLLNTTAEGLYKLKQRLAKKLNLKNTKELDSYLHEKAILKN